MDVFTHSSTEITGGTSSSRHSHAVRASLYVLQPLFLEPPPAFLQEASTTSRNNLREVSSTLPVPRNPPSQVEAAGKNYGSVKTGAQKIMSRTSTPEKPTSAKETSMLSQNSTENGSLQGIRDGETFKSNCKTF